MTFHPKEANWGGMESWRSQASEQAGAGRLGSIQGDTGNTEAREAAVIQGAREVPAVQRDAAGQAAREAPLPPWP